MKQLLFSVYQDKVKSREKRQTIRLHKPYGTCPECGRNGLLLKESNRYYCKKCGYPFEWEEQTTRFKVGEKVRLIDAPRGRFTRREDRKDMGVEEISRVFLIKMGTGWLTIENYPKMGNQGEGWHLADGLAREDGFGSAKEMFEWFSKRYSLDTPKRFVVYCW